MFYTRRVVDIPDGKPKWSGLQNASELIADSPRQAVKELKRKREEEELEKKTKATEEDEVDSKEEARN